MIDCPNVEMRDRLPDLANETMVLAERELLLAHLTECTACTAEIEILRTTRLILVQSTPKVNVAGIVAALPQYGVTSIAAAPSVGRRWGNSWRIAAAVTFLAAGIGSYELMTKESSPAHIADTLVAATTAETPVMGMALTASLTNMSDAELSALASDIENIEALPSTEVETTSRLNVLPILPDSVVQELEISQ